MTFYEVVVNELKDCKTYNEIAKRSFELMKVIADVSWEAEAVRQTNEEAKGLSKHE